MLHLSNHATPGYVSRFQAAVELASAAVPFSEVCASRNVVGFDCKLDHVGPYQVTCKMGRDWRHQKMSLCEGNHPDNLLHMSWQGHPADWDRCHLTWVDAIADNDDEECDPANDAL